MLPGPIFRRELKTAARPRSLFVIRTVLGLALAAIMILAGLGSLGWEGMAKDVYEPHELSTFGGMVLIALIAVEITFLMPVALTMVSPSIAEEREKDTLPLLLLTRLTHLEIVLTKLLGRLIPAICLVLVGLPLIAGCAWCAGLPALLVVQAMAMVISTVTVTGAFSILASARRDRAGTARAQAMVWVIVWVCVIPSGTVIPVRAGTLWGDLAIEVQRLCAWIAPSSPLSLVTQNAWFSNRDSQALTEQVVFMLGFQAIMVVLAILAATSALQIRERHPFSRDAYHGFRPPVGDDPVFWREFTLPFRGAKQPLIVAQARQIVILLRIMFSLILQLLVMMLAVAVPIGLVIATVRYGYFAFLELASDGYFPEGPAPARGEFNLLIRGVTGYLALLPLLTVPAMTTARVTIERDKKTWEGLLMTPLTGAEILSAKMRVSARGLWASSRWLIPLWTLGILAGSLHPLTALVAAIELPLAAWASLALAVWLAVRPRSKLTTTANSHAATASMVIGAIVVLSVLALLCSHGELAEFGTWGIWVRIIITATLLALPPLLGVLAWVLIRRTFRRFDEWVGRPHRGLAKS